MTEKTEKSTKPPERRRTALEAMALVAVLALAFIGLWMLAGYVTKSDEVSPPEDEIKVSLRIQGDGWEIEYLNVYTLNNTVYDLLMECSQTRDFSVEYTFWPGYDAIFINAINGTENGDNSMWWQYYVNGDYGEIGCDKKELFDGDVVEWRFEEPGQ